ncbi:hypothetical protein NB706_002037 [Xanthomonas sacchari]|nr:hypothetical protein [Xanthomonas sacchari]
MQGVAQRVQHRLRRHRQRGGGQVAAADAQRARQQHVAAAVGAGVAELLQRVQHAPHRRARNAGIGAELGHADVAAVLAEGAEHGQTACQRGHEVRVAFAFADAPHQFRGQAALRRGGGGGGARGAACARGTRGLGHGSGGGGDASDGSGCACGRRCRGLVEGARRQATVPLHEAGGRGGSCSYGSFFVRHANLKRKQRLSPFRASYFSLLAQRKGNQKKARPAYAPSALRAPGPRPSRGSAEGASCPCRGRRTSMYAALRVFPRDGRRFGREPSKSKTRATATSKAKRSRLLQRLAVISVRARCGKDSRAFLWDQSRQPRTFSPQSPSRTTSLPKLPPLSMSMKACGAFSSPSTTCSR